MEDLQELKVIAKRWKLVRRPAGAGVEHGVVAEYNAEELADVSEDEEAGEGKAVCGKESRKAKEIACQARHSPPGHTLFVQSS